MKWKVYVFLGLGGLMSLSLIALVSIYKSSSLRVSLWSPSQESRSQEPEEILSQVPEPSPKLTMPQSQVPAHTKQPYTNESLQVFLEEEKKRMGIKEILPEESQLKSMSGETFSRDEAKENMRRMASQMTLLNQQRQARLPPPVFIRQNSKPKLLSNQEEARPLQQQENPTPTGGKSLSTITDTRGVSVGDPVSSPTKSIKSVSISERSPRIWRGWTTPGLPGAGVIKNNQDWTDLWQRLDRTEQPPIIDFNREMAVIILGDAKKGHRPIILSALQEGQQYIIRYRQELPKQSQHKQGQVAYHISIFPISNLPISFIKMP
jgi:hypothetical protein